MKKALKAAFKATMPVFFGYIFVGMAFGLLCQRNGYNFIWALFIGIGVYSGSMQFVLLNLLMGGAGIAEAVITTLIVNARYALYGISFTNLFKKMKRVRPYMIHTLTDEVYAIMCSVKTPLGVNRKQLFLAIAGLSHFYWVLGGVLGAILGSAVHFNSKGIDFAMTALFIVIFVDQFLTFPTRTPSILGILSGLVYLIFLGSKNMLIPSIAIIIVFLIVFKPRLEKKIEAAKKRGVK